MKRSDPYITTLMQFGLLWAGYKLPKFGADGKWGEETQEAYDTYVLRSEAPSLKDVHSDQE